LTPSRHRAPPLLWRPIHPLRRQFAQGEIGVIGEEGTGVVATWRTGWRGRQRRGGGAVARGHQGRGLSPDAVQKKGFWENKAMSLCASLHYKRWYRRVLPVCALPPPKIVSQLSGLCTYFSKKLRRVGTEAKVGLVVGRNRFLPSADPPSLSCLSELQYRNKLFLEISKEETRTRCARQTVCSVCPYGKKKKNLASQNLVLN
jgi:hypothetical protein